MAWLETPWWAHLGSDHLDPSVCIAISAHQCSSVLISAPWLGPPGSKWPLQAPPPPCLLPRSSPHP